MRVYPCNVLAGTQEFTPESKLKRELLISLGWKVKHLSYKNWAPVSGDARARMRLLMSLLPPRYMYPPNIDARMNSTAVTHKRAHTAGAHRRPKRDEAHTHSHEPAHTPEAHTAQRTKHTEAATHTYARRRPARFSRKY